MSKIKEMVIAQGTKGFVTYNFVDLNEWEPVFGEKALSHSFLQDSFRKIMGRTLTIIDASVIDKDQNKAMKDLVRNIFSVEMEFADNMAYDQNKLTHVAGEHFKDATDEELENSSVSIEEALGVK